MSLDQTDKKILREVQSRLPIDPQPYKLLGQRLGLSEAEVLERLARMKKSGVIRRIGGNFQSHLLGFKSTLCAAKVPEDKLELFIDTVNSYPGVTHNYLRAHEYNVWFTLIAESMDLIAEQLEAIAQATGVEGICSFPARKLFKIKVDFPVQ